MIVDSTPKRGPAARVQWIGDDDARRHAKQAETLDIDERAAAAWLQTMRELVAKDLSDEEFTLERMAALKAWERRRKRDQHNLHYKYDPARRNPALVERDVDRQLAKLKERAAALSPRLSQAAERVIGPTAALAPDEETLDGASQRPTRGPLPDVDDKVLLMRKIARKAGDQSKMGKRSTSGLIDELARITR